MVDAPEAKVLETVSVPILLVSGAVRTPAPAPCNVKALDVVLIVELTGLVTSVNVPLAPSC